MITLHLYKVNHDEKDYDMNFDILDSEVHKCCTVEFYSSKGDKAFEYLKNLLDQNRHKIKFSTGGGLTYESVEITDEDFIFQLIHRDGIRERFTVEEPEFRIWLRRYKIRKALQ